jgi:hypothetical protein
VGMQTGVLPELISVNVMRSDDEDEHVHGLVFRFGELGTVGFSRRGKSAIRFPAPRSVTPSLRLTLESIGLPSTPAAHRFIIQSWLEGRCNRLEVQLTSSASPPKAP